MSERSTAEMVESGTVGEMSGGEAGRDRAPRVSVALATHQGAAFLPQQLESLTRQLQLPDELVVVDDASTDGTVELLRDFARTAPFPVEVVARTTHRGTMPTFEESLRRSTGDLVFICDQDDRWREDKISVHTRRLEERPSALLAFSDASLIDAAGEPLGQSRWHVAGFTPELWPRMEADGLAQLLFRQVVSGCTLVLRKELIPALVPFPSGLYPAWPDMMYDRWISLVAAAARPVVVVPEQLVEYRIHPRQQMGIPKLTIRRVAPRMVVKAGQLVPGREEQTQRVEYHLAHLAEIEKRLTVSGLASAESEDRLFRATRHLGVRLGIGGSRAGRVRKVLAEYRNPDGYRRFSFGMATAVADLFR